MYELEKTFCFEAAHFVRTCEGKCQRIHGHSFQLTLKLRADQLAQEGAEKNMIVNLLKLDELVGPMLDTYLDHRLLNETLACESPTLEFMAHWIYHFLKPKLTPLFAVTLSAGNQTSATYFGD